MVPQLVRYFKKPLPANSFCKKMLLFFFLLSLLADVWASHSQAPADDESVALLDNHHKMENTDIPLDENTKRALRLTVELGCRSYALKHSTESYESEAVASRVYFNSLESVLQMFFPGCKIANLKDIQKHPFLIFNASPYVVTTAGKYGTGFYTRLISPRIWIRFKSSQPKSCVHLRAFVERNSKHFDILRLRDIERDILAKILSPPDLTERVIGNDITTSQTVFRYAIAHTVQSASSATTPELYKEAVYNGLSRYFSKLELHQHVFSPNVSYVAKAPAFTVYKRDLPLMFYTNESKLMIKGCIPLHVELYGPSKTMGMIVAGFSRQTFAIYFRSVNTKALVVMLGLLHHFADKLKDFDLMEQDRFFELFEKEPVD